MSSHFPLLIAGATASGKAEVHSPYNNDLIATVDLAGADAMEQALRNAAESYEKIMRHMPAHERASYLYKVAEQIGAHHEDLALTIAREGGKPLKDARVEVSRAMNSTKMAGDIILHRDGEQISMDRAKGTENHLAIVIHEGVGPVLAISAFNHPLNLICHQLCTAFAAGNSVIVKPALQTPISCLKLAGFFKQAGLPDGVISVITAGGPESEMLVRDPRIKFLTFIGSEAVGFKLAKLVAPGVRVALEHGGTATAIVSAKADLATAIPSIVRGAFYHAGQVCVSTQNLYVHASIFDSVLAQLKTAAAKLVTGDPSDAATDVGPIISAQALQRIELWLKEAVADGAKIELGGQRVGQQNLAPTILTNVKHGMQAVCKEVFGPTLNLISYTDIKQVIAETNQSNYAFQAAIYTQDIDEGMNAAKAIDAKAVMINDSTAFRVDWMPFGGKKHSGLGTGGIKNSIEDMSEKKLIVIRVRA